jgi:mevalonate kinase
MPAFTKTAPGKVILFGEHAVVYGRPAIAVPVQQVRARAIVIANPLADSGEVKIQAPDIELEATFGDLPSDHPIYCAINGVQKTLGITRLPAFILRIVSNIPIASGLGSGAAVTVAIIRALSEFLGHPLPPERVSELAFEVEKLHHGTPSGIDNTVITYAKPVFFIKGDTFETIHLPEPFTIVIADTGIQSPTAVVVGDLRRCWQEDPAYYTTLFDTVGKISVEARWAIENGQPQRLGTLMDENHEILSQMGVSSPELDHLVEVARDAGALGAKLSGGGRGGNIIALVDPVKASEIEKVLLDRGATNTIVTIVRDNN